MSVTDHDKIRLRAFQIWEAEGRQEGWDLEYWVCAEVGLSTMPAPKRAKPTAAVKKTVKISRGEEGDACGCR